MSERCTAANIKSASCFAFGALCRAVRLPIPFLLVDRRPRLVSLAFALELGLLISGILHLDACSFEV